MTGRETSERAVNLREGARVLQRRKWYLILAVLGVTGGAIGGSFLLAPRYESTALIRLGGQNIPGTAVGGLTPEGSERRYDLRAKAERVEVLRRRVLSLVCLEQLIDRMGWVDKVLAGGRPEAQYAQLGPDAGQAALTRLVDRLQKQIRVNLVGNDYVEITFSSAEPVQAKEAATHLAAIFRDNMIKEEVASIRAAGELSEEQLEKYRGKWEEAQNSLAELESHKTGETVNDRRRAEQNLRDIVTEKNEVSLELANALDGLGQLESLLGIEGVARADFVYSDRLTALRSEQLSLIDRWGNLLGKYTWKDKVIADYNHRLGTGLNNIKVEITRIVDEALANLSPVEHDATVELVYLQTKLDLLKKEQQVLNRTVSRIRGHLATGPEYKQQLRRLEAEEAGSRDIYDRFVEQYTAAQLRRAEHLAAAETRYTLVEPPLVPRSPVYPDRYKIATIAAIIGLALGFALVFLAEHNDHSFRAVEEVEDHLGYRVLAAVPRIEALKEARFAGKR